jgi:CheY-like chemotaxis protein/HPt (histidine-containing phosphotransfer) domain-containing protein
MARVQQGELQMQTGDDGTMLTLTLRALGSEQLPPPPRLPAGVAAPRASDLAPARVLVVDDDEYNRLLLLRYLPTPPFTIEAAAHGQAAIEAAQRQWPDIVLVDLEMPVMNGLEAVRWLREEEARQGRKRCLVVMMSSNDDAGSIREGIAAGSDRYLGKPFTRETLLAVLQDLRTSGGAPVPMAVPAPLPSGPAAPMQAEEPVRVDPELLPEVPAFLDSRRSMVDGMAAALASGNRSQLRAVAHRAAGGLALFGFHWAAWQSRRISARAVEAEPQELREDIERLREHLETVQVE